MSHRLALAAHTTVVVTCVGLSLALLGVAAGVVPAADASGRPAATAPTATCPAANVPAANDWGARGTRGAPNARIGVLRDA